MIWRIRKFYENKRPKNRYYLRELGLKRYEIADDYAIFRPKRLFLFWRQRRKYGFDERITWSLNNGMAQLMYERLLMYRDIGGQMVELDWDYYEYEWEGKSYNLLGIINLMIEKLEIYLTEDFEDEEAYKAYEDFLDLYKLCYQMLWW